VHIDFQNRSFVMRYGLYLPNFGFFGDVHTLVELAVEAEAAGWDGFFLWDHIAGEQMVPFVDPWVALAALVVHTERIRLGTQVTPLPRRRPWKVARETVTLDHLSHGRLTLGIGIGGGGHEWDHLDEETSVRTRAAMLDEGMAVLSGLWSGQPFSYEGRYYTVKDQQFLPVPVQSPRIPVWVGGFWPNKGPFRRAARWDGMFPLFAFGLTPEEERQQFAAAVAYVRQQRSDESPLDVVRMGVTPGDDPARAAQIVQPYAEAGATWWLEMLACYRYDRPRDEPWMLEAMRERVRQGPPRMG
jgi:alkanesulfonate monooxygenase SsuD/methylene tetrahydromethanopterin reductase-like flavin-dependent oxidoreductase (luciferase family)